MRRTCDGSEHRWCKPEDACLMCAFCGTCYFDHHEETLDACCSCDAYRPACWGHLGCIPELVLRDALAFGIDDVRLNAYTTRAGDPSWIVERDEGMSEPSFVSGYVRESLLRWFQFMCACDDALASLAPGDQP